MQSLNKQPASYVESVTVKLISKTVSSPAQNIFGLKAALAARPFAWLSPSSDGF